MQHLDEATLQAWVDRARFGLDPSKLAQIEQHLVVCGSCASQAEALGALGLRAHALLAIGRERHAPRVTYEDVVRRAHGSRTRMRKIKATWAASVVVALGLGWVSNNLYRAGFSPDAAGAAGTSSLATSTQSTTVLGGSPGAPSPGAASVAGTAASDPSRLRSAADVASNVASASGNPNQDTSAGAAGSTASRVDPDGVVVRGFVADEGGRPVPSAEVYVAELEVGVLTQQNGRYDLQLLSEPDSFELTVQRIGFRQQTRALNSGEGDYIAADFRLREEALALDEIIVTGEADGTQSRSSGNRTAALRAAPFVWRPAPSIAAEGYVGSDLWTMPEMDVLALEVAYGDNPNETHVARVRQALGGGRTLTLIQGRTDGRRTRWPIQSAGAVVSTWRGEMLITATAAVSADSLRVLLSQLR